MLEQEAPYSFESRGRTFLRDTQSAQAERKKIAARLGFSEQIPSTLFDEQLRQLALHCNLSILWYENKLAREVRARRWYFAISVGLLLVIPIALCLIAHYDAASGHPAAAVTAQLSAVLAGLLAFHRGISAWLDRRQVVGAYSKAASDLKTILYEFEQTWDQKATDANNAIAFTLAIRQAVAKSRDVVRIETAAYYQTLSYPSLDLGSLAKSSALDASQLIQTFGSSLFAVPNVTAARLEQLRSKVRELDAQLQRARSTNDAAAVVALTRIRDTALRELRAAELDSPTVGTI
jgi:hypothetical protein